MKVTAIKTRIFEEGEDLISFITTHVRELNDKSVLVVTSKIAALSEGRTVAITSEKEKEKLIKKESSLAIKTKYVWLTIKDGTLMANAGIDESNAKNRFILLPHDSFKTASIVRKRLMKHFGLVNLGIIITDSRTEPLKRGITGKTLGYAGFVGVKNYVGKKDLYGRKFKFESVNVADSLASAAVLEMGEGNECRPLAVIEDVDIKFKNNVNRSETIIPMKDDMYGPFIKNIKKRI